MKSINAFTKALNLFDITEISEIIPKDNGFIYPFHSYKDEDVKTLLKKEMSTCNAEQKAYILTQKQSPSKTSPEMFFLTKEHCYYLSFDSGIKIFDTTFKELIHINPYTNMGGVEIKLNLLNVNKRLPNSYLEISKTLKLGLDVSEPNHFSFFKPAKTGISSIAISPDTISVDVKRCFYNKMLLDANFKILELHIRDIFLSTTGGMLSPVIYNITDFDHLLLKIKEYSEVHSLMEDKSFNPKVDEEKFIKQLHDIKLIVNNSAEITPSLKDIQKKLDPILSMESTYKFINIKSLKSMTVLARKSTEFQKFIGDNTFEEILKGKGSYLKKDKNAATIAFLWHVKKHATPLITSEVINNISLLQDSIKSMKGILSETTKNESLKIKP